MSLHAAPTESSLLRAEVVRIPSSGADVTAPPPPFEAIYDVHFAFVWRSARRLGVAEAALDDVVQETFVIAHRRLAEFEGRSTLKTWLFGIVLRVAREHRRTLRRKSPERAGEGPVDPETLAAQGGSPYEHAAKAEAVRVLYMILDEMDDDKREVFVLAELEQMSAPEIGEALEMNVNTVYTRLRAARIDFEKGVARQRAKDAWRTP